MWFPQVWATDAVSWQSIDDTTAIGGVAVGDLAVEAEFRFDTEGRLIDFRADRYRVDEEPTLTPWRTPITDHATFSGVEVPTRGCAIWKLETGELEYIRLHITDLQFL